MKQSKKTEKTAQEIQDGIFRRMSADRKIKLGSRLWQLAKSLTGDKINYAARRPQRSISRYR